MGDEDDSDDLEPEEELGRIWIPGRDDGGSGTNIADLRRLQGQRDADIEVARRTFKKLLKEVDAARIDTGQAKRITKAAAALDKLKQLQSQFAQSAASVDPAKWEKELTLQYRKARRAIEKLESSGEGGGGGASGGAEATKSGGGSKGEPRARGSSVEKTTHWAHRDFLKNRPPIVAEAALLVMLEQRKGVAVAFYVQTVLHNVAKDFTGSAESTARLVRTLVEQKAEVGAADDAGRTPLHSAAAHNKGPAESVSALVRALAEAKAEVGARDKKDRTPLHSAAAHNKGPTESVSALVCALTELNATLDVRDNAGHTPLHSAAAHNTGPAESVSALVYTLVKVKAEVGARDKGGRTPLHNAAAFNKGPAESVSALVCALAELKAEIDARDNHWRTPLHCVAAFHTGPAESVSELVRTAVEQKAGVGAMDEGDRTPLHSAPVFNTGPAESASALVRTLVKLKAAVGAQDYEGWTPLHLVVGQDRDMGPVDSVLALANALLGAKAEIDATDNQGRTPLHLAVRSRGLLAEQVAPLLLMLLGDKAGVLETDAAGRTPLDFRLMERLTNKPSAGAVSTGHSAAESSSVVQTLAASDAAASSSLRTLLAHDMCQDDSLLHNAVCTLRDTVQGLGEVKEAVARAVLRGWSDSSERLGHFVLGGQSQASRSHVAKVIGAVFLAARQHPTKGAISTKEPMKWMKRPQQVVDMRGIDIIGSDSAATRSKVLDFLGAHKGSVIVFDDVNFLLRECDQSLAAVALSTWMSWLQKHSNPTGRRVDSAETVTCIVAGSVELFEAPLFRDSKFRSLFQFLPGVVTSAHIPMERKGKLTFDSSSLKREGQGVKSEVKPESAAESELLP